MGIFWIFWKCLNTELTDGRTRDNTDVKRCGLNISYKKLPTLWCSDPTPLTVNSVQIVRMQGKYSHYSSFPALYPSPWPLTNFLHSKMNMTMIGSCYLRNTILYEVFNLIPRLSLIQQGQGSAFSLDIRFSTSLLAFELFVPYFFSCCFVLHVIRLVCQSVHLSVYHNLSFFL